MARPARRGRRGRPPGTRSEVILLGEQGRIVLPRDVRLRLGIVAGDELSLEEGERGLLLRPTRGADMLLRQMRRRWLSLGVSLEDLLRERREQAKRERRARRV